MPKKNDLSAFKAVNLETPKILEKPKLVAPSAPVTRGRKKKPTAEKESEAIIFKVTKAEKEKLLDKAGMVPMGTYLKHILRTETDIFE